MTQELAEIGTIHQMLPGLRKPKDILAEAQERASALQDVVKKTKSSQNIGGKEHLKIEAWVTIGQFYGCTARCKDAEPVEIHGIPGFKAHAEVVHDQSGIVLSEATAFCLRDEDRWNSRSVYEWVNKVKTKVGEENVPMFQLASMAQTRAMAKALAAKFRWVVVLAGYAETPAEEMTGNESEIHNEPKEQKPQSSGQLMPGYAGKYANKPVADMTLETLKEFYPGLIKSIADPSKATWKERNQKVADAMKARIDELEAASPKDSLSAVELTSMMGACESMAELSGLMNQAVANKDQYSTEDYEAIELVFKQIKPKFEKKAKP